ncbi:hypothetical protein EW026_g3409 [Hermanssonia centrifuga]|uniref:Amino acid transporter n=1 Tax=Hermanssonia centrifuga TaxID=98765 RepID=A0A4S4KL92_9APHY|nr:hypothetical protein EW026_g3409 [Hermanssonia centrifuga]
MSTLASANLSVGKGEHRMSLDAKSMSSTLEDDKILKELGYAPSFKREFSNLATYYGVVFECRYDLQHSSLTRRAGFSNLVLDLGIMYVSYPCIAEIVSAFPTCGGLYTASAQLCPPKHRAVVGWIIGWLSVLAQIVGLSSSEFGLANMIWAAVVIGKDGDYAVTAGKTVGLCTALLIVHGLLNCLATKWLSRLTSGFVFVNIGTTLRALTFILILVPTLLIYAWYRLVIIVTLLATTPRSEMHTASYVFGSEGIVNGTGGWNAGIAFLFGLLSVQWTMTQDYDATAHISEEVRRAAYSAPSAIFIAVIGTGLLGWLLNIVMVLCSGPLENLPGPSDSAFLEILVLRLGKPGALFLWSLVCLTAFFVCQTGLQAGSRTVYAFSRDNGLPDRGYFGQVSTRTKTPIRAIWFTTLFSILPGLLDLASPVAANAIFAMTAMAFDLSYIVPIFLRRVYQNHPEVNFKPGPFYMGDGMLGWVVNINCILWTLFVSVLFSMPNYLPVDKNNMNYASLITGGVVILSMVWYFLG